MESGNSPRVVRYMQGNFAILDGNYNIVSRPVINKDGQQREVKLKVFD